MPRIPDVFLGFTVYLYPTKDDAQEGRRYGGTGFVISYSETKPSGHKLGYFYVVSNAHVIARSPVIRINTKDQQFSIIELTSNHWIHHPEGSDIAVYPLDSKILSENTYDLSTKKGVSFFPHTGFISEEDIQTLNIGPGDDVYFIGRFINHEGKQKNLPSVRFGTIAQMPGEKINVDKILPQEAFLVEARSIQGYSGSPVIIHIPAFSNRWDGKGLGSEYHTRLLGVTCAFLPFQAKLFDSQTGKLVENYYVEGNSGMAVVIPAWKINDILSLKELILDRQKGEQQYFEQLENAESLTTTDDEEVENKVD